MDPHRARGDGGGAAATARDRGRRRPRSGQSAVRRGGHPCGPRIGSLEVMPETLHAATSAQIDLSTSTPGASCAMRGPGPLLPARGPPPDPPHRRPRGRRAVEELGVPPVRRAGSVALPEEHGPRRGVRGAGLQDPQRLHRAAGETLESMRPTSRPTPTPCRCTSRAAARRRCHVALLAAGGGAGQERIRKCRRCNSLRASARGEPPGPGGQRCGSGSHVGDAGRAARAGWRP